MVVGIGAPTCWVMIRLDISDIFREWNWCRRREGLANRGLSITSYYR
jgi:hypothetical protein